MEIVFEKEYLSELYHTGKTKDKSHRFQPQVIKRYKRVIYTLQSVNRLEDLFLYNSLNFEALYNDYYSVRIDIHYRLLFQMEKENEVILIKGYIIDITNHYN